jgi:PAS domain S-box-containing protein
LPQGDGLVVMQNIRNKKQPDGRVPINAEPLHRWYLAPAAIFVLGMLSLAMLLWIYSLEGNMRMDINISNALNESRIKTATFHLWLEQAVAGDDTANLWTAQAELEQAAGLIAAMLEGGQSENGLTLQPIRDQVLREKAGMIQTKLEEYKRIADQRIRDPQRGKIGSSSDRHFDALFRSIQARLEDLKVSIERRHIRDQINWRFRYTLILIAWLSAILIAIAGLWFQEVKRKAIAEALQSANEALQFRTEELKEHEDHLQEMVDRRTAELTRANQTLQQENSERKKAEESLQASESRFRSLVEHLPLSIALKDKYSVYQYCNHACARDLEIAPQEVLGKTDRDFFPPELAERHIAEDARILSSGQPEETTEKYFKHGREVIVQKIKLPVTYDVSGNGADGLLSIVQDITEKTRLESIAEAANTMKNIGYVFAGVRHELGNPVNAIKITLSLLLSRVGTASAETIREYVGRAMAETEKIEYLLRTLKNFNMFETLELKGMPLQTFLERFLSLATGDFAKKGILIRSHIQPEAMFVTADPRALQQVLLNIMSNAADALDGRENSEIVIEASKMDGFIRIRVTDNGDGMSEQQQEELFMPFHTTKPGGTGLGLVIAKKMLTAMKGDIAISSREGTGTTVDITLPGGGKQ